MNRRALVLAADSAGTVTTWVNGRRERRYFKGENKIFQLSESRPIGLMTFGDADFVGVPWELIVKKVSLGTGWSERAQDGARKPAVDPKRHIAILNADRAKICEAPGLFPVSTNAAFR